MRVAITSISQALHDPVLNTLIHGDLTRAQLARRLLRLPERGNMDIMIFTGDS
jgi:hypothetical protein